MSAEGKPGAPGFPSTTTVSTPKRRARNKPCLKWTCAEDQQATLIHGFELPEPDRSVKRGHSILYRCDTAMSIGTCDSEQRQRLAMRREWGRGGIEI